MLIKAFSLVILSLTRHISEFVFEKTSKCPCVSTPHPDSNQKTKTIEPPIITGHYFGMYSTLNSFNKEYNKIKELIHAFFYKKIEMHS